MQLLKGNKETLLQFYLSFLSIFNNDIELLKK